MTRKRLRLLAVCALMAPAGALALGVGPIQVRSALNQTLDAEIELLSVSDDQLSDITIQLAPPQAFAASGIERPGVLSDLDFSVVTRGDGRRVVEVRSTRPIREPFLNFLLEVAAPGGRLVREFTVFLDPPAFATAPPASGMSQASRGRPAEAGGRPGTTAPPPYTGGGRYGPVAPGQTLWSIAESLRPDRSVSIQQMMEALLRLNPDAFTAPNVDSLAAGVTLRVPAPGDIRAVPAADRRPPPSPPAAEASSAEDVAGAQEPATAPPEEEAEVATVRLLEPDAPAVPDEAGSGSGETVSASAEVEPGASADGRATPLTPAVASLAPALQIRRQDGALVLRRADIDELQQRMRALVGVDNAALTAVQESERSATVLPDPVGEGTTAADRGAAPAVDTPPSASTEPQILPPPAQSPLLAPVARVLRDPLVLAGGGAGVLLLIALAVLLVRRLRLRRQAVESEPASARGVEADRSEEPFTQDPLERADLMLAVGNYQEAESTIRKAIAASPMEPTLLAKLLDIHFATGDADSFRSEAEKLHRRLEHEDDPLWQHAAERGRQLCPGDALFERAPGAGAEASDAPQRAPVHLAFSSAKGGAASDRQSAGTVEELPPAPAEVPLSTGTATPGERRSVDPTVDEQRDEERRTDESPEFLGALEWEPGTGDAAAEEASPSSTRAAVKDRFEASGSGDEQDLEPLELEPVAEPGGLDFELPDEAQRPGQTRGGDRPVASVTDAGLDDEEDFVETKLDLASAYMDMGDPAGARGYLDEVMEEGSSAQKQRAEKLLAQMTG